MGVQAEWLVAEPAGTWVRSLLQGPGGRPPQPGGSSPADAPASWVSMRAPAFRVRLLGSEGCSQLIQPPVPLPAWCPNTPSAAGQLSLRLSPSPPRLQARHTPVLPTRSGVAPPSPGVLSAMPPRGRVCAHSSAQLTPVSFVPVS